MTNNLKYSEYLDTIIALVSHLSISKYQSRTIKNLSKDLGINQIQIEQVLNGFPGIFRKSIKLSLEEENYYTLQMRYARRWRGNTDEEEENNENPEGVETPLVDDKYISLLFEFITNMVNQEKEDWRHRITNIITIIASFLAFIASIIAIIISITK